MAQPQIKLSVDEGPLSAEDRIDDVPRERWNALVGLRKSFLHIHLPHDCRQLLRFVEEADAHRMWEVMGVADRETFLRDKLDLDPEDVTWALHALRRWKPAEPVPYERAIALGQQEIGKGKAGPGRGKKTLAGGHRFSGGSDPSYKLARLERDRPDLHARVLTGKLSLHSAMIEAGFRPRTFSVVDDPFRAVAKLVKRYGYEKVAAALASHALLP